MADQLKTPPSPEEHLKKLREKQKADRRKIKEIEQRMESEVSPHQKMRLCVGLGRGLLPLSRESTSELGPRAVAVVPQTAVDLVACSLSPLRPLRVRRTPMPTILRPPAPPFASSHRGERASHDRAVDELWEDHGEEDDDPGTGDADKTDPRTMRRAVLGSTAPVAPDSITSFGRQE